MTPEERKFVDEVLDATAGYAGQATTIHNSLIGELVNAGPVHVASSIAELTRIHNELAKDGPGSDPLRMSAYLVGVDRLIYDLNRELRGLVNEQDVSSLKTTATAEDILKRKSKRTRWWRRKVNHG